MINYDYKRKSGLDWENKKNRECIILANMGFGYRYIEHKTGLSIGQINYRLRMANVFLKDYRDGHSRTAQQAQKLLRPTAVVQCNKQLDLDF